MMKTIFTVLLIVMLITPAYGALVPYESNQVSDNFEIRKPVIIFPHEIWLPDDWNPMITLTNRANNQISGTRSTSVSLVFFYRNGTEARRHELGFSPIYTDYIIPVESEQSWSLPYNHGIDDAMQQWKAHCETAYCRIKILLHLEVTNP